MSAAQSNKKSCLNKKVKMVQNGGQKAFDEERRKKRMKCFAYVAAFAVFQTDVMLVFAVVVMKVRTPKFRVRSATFDDFQVSTLVTNASFQYNNECRSFRQECKLWSLQVPR